jgi:hypothetical protein
VSYEFYKVLHMLGLMVLFFSLGGYTLRSSEGGTKPTRILLASTHGIGLLLVLVAGFGLLARLKLGGVPGWAWIKVVLWLAFGAAPVLIKRTPERLRPVWVALPLLGAIAAYLAINKPFA